MSKIFVDEIYAKNVLQRMWEQCQREQFCDVVLIAGPKGIRVPAHRFVLCAASDYFETMFTSSFKESTAREVHLPSVDGDIAKELLKYCYTGQIQIGVNNAKELLETADLLFLEFVVSACGDFLAEQLDPTNCLGLALFAEQHHCESLLKQAKDYRNKHFVELYTTDEFLELNALQLGQLLASDNLNVKAEEDIFKSLKAWLDRNRFEREQYKYELFKLLRMPMMKSSFLMQHVRPECISAECQQLYEEAMKWHSFRFSGKLNSSKSTQPRRSYQFLMAITLKKQKLNILCHCTERLKWMKWSKDLEFREHFSIIVMDSNLFILGGMIGNHTVNTIICLNLSTMTSNAVSPMIECRESAVAVVSKGFLYVVGGVNGRDILNSAEKWDSKTNTWSVVASMGVNRFNTAIAVLNEKLYVLGGWGQQGTLNSAEYYDPQENVWTTIAAMNEKREFAGVAVVDGMLYAVGGDTSNTIERYEPECDKWSMISSVSEKMYSVTLPCTTFNDKVVMLYKDHLQEYNPSTNEWKVNTSISGLRNVHCLFSYSGELPMSEFVES